MGYALHKIMNVVIHILVWPFITAASLFKRWFSRKESFTLMVIPHAPVKNVKSVKFSRWVVSIFVLLNFIMFSVVCVFAASYYTLSIKLENKRTEYQTLQVLKENEEKQLDEYKLNETVIKEKIDVLKDLENKLKDIIETKGGKPQSSSIGRMTLASRGEALYSRPRSTVLTEFESFEDMFDVVDQLAVEVDSNINELNDAITRAENEELAMRAKPLVFPTNGNITSGFGYRKNPFGKGYEFHTGVDIANSKGTPIKASGDGIVTNAGWDSGGYGYLVKINHNNGYESLYGHNSKIVVHVGQEVKRGEVIAYMGSTGRSTGNHSHFEVRLNGKPINPYNVE